MPSKGPPRTLFQPSLRSLKDHTDRRQTVQVPRPGAAVARARSVDADATGKLDGFHGGSAFHEQEAFLGDADFGKDAVAARGFLLVLEVADLLLDGGLDVTLVLVVVVDQVFGLGFDAVYFFGVLFCVGIGLETGQHNGRVRSVTYVVEKKFHLPGSFALDVQRARHPDAHVAGLNGVGLGPFGSLTLGRPPFAIVALLHGNSNVSQPVSQLLA